MIESAPVFDELVSERTVRGSLKALVIGVMMFTSVNQFTDSFSKALLIGAIAALVSIFSTWRRYLEPISFVLFCLSVLTMFEINWKGALAAIRALF